MIRTLLFVIFNIFFHNNLIAQDAYWVSTIKSDGYDDCNDLYSDKDGNVFVTGQIEYTASFDGYNLSSVGSHDIFVARYDAFGNLIWAKRAGGSDGDIGLSIAVDNDLNVFVTGEFESTSDFDGITKTAQGSNNMFIAKYDTIGNVLWVKSIGTNSGSTIGYAVACDASGNVYACGTTRAKAIYNGSTLFTSRGSEDILLIKFSSEGNYIWHKQIGGSDSDEGFGLTIVGENLYVTGSFEGNARFTSSFTLNDIGGKDFFLAKYDTSGSFQWAKAGGSGGDDFGNDITINSNGNIVCTGEFRGNAMFDNNAITSNGRSDMFIVAYDTNGSNLWAISGGGNEIDFGSHIANDENGNLFIGGTYADAATFNQTTVMSNGEEDVFLASYDSSGNFRFVKAFGGPHHDRGKGTGTDKYGNVYFSGDYWDNIGFDTFNIDGNDLYDGFIVRFGNLPICGLEINNSVVINTTCFGCNDGSIGIIVTGGTPPYSYHWSDGAITEDRNNLSEGLYNVCITDVNNCVLCESYNVIDQPLSTGDLGSCTFFRVFPNPVQTESIIQFDNPSLIGKLKVELFNYLNVKIKTIPVLSNNALLSASEFSNGIYFMQIKNRESDEVLNVIPVVIQK